MIGSLVNFFYGETPQDICVIIGEYAGECAELFQSDDVDEEEDDTLFLVYDLKNRKYFYAMLNELSFVY